MTPLERKVNDVNEKYFLPLLSQEMWQEEFTSVEYIQAKNFIQPYLNCFKKLDLKLILLVLKSQIKCMRWMHANISCMDEKQFREDSIQHIQLHNNIPRFIKLMRCFQFANNSGDFKTDIQFEKRTKLFNVTKITFESERKGNKIVLEGKIIDLVKLFFDELGKVNDENDLKKLQLFSEDLYHEFWEIWFSYIGKKSLVKRRIIPRSVQQFVNEMKMMRSYQFHRFLCQYSSINDGQKITEQEKRFIGDFLIMVGFCQSDDSEAPHFLDTVHYNDVRNWIVRGKYL